MSYKALILGAGTGTRLNPLTLTRPAPLIEFCNKPIVFHQIDALIEAGVTEIILSIQYLGEMLEERVTSYVKDKQVELIVLKEEEAMGIGASINMAKKHLQGDEPFFVLYGNSVGTYDFVKMMEKHRSVNVDGTVMVTNVNSTEKEGENERGEGGEGEGKERLAGDDVGIYIFTSPVLDHIPKDEPTPMKILTNLTKSCKLAVYNHKSFGGRILDSSKFYSGSLKSLASIKETAPDTLGHASLDVKHGLIDRSVTMGKGCFIGERVVIGENVRIGDGVYLNDCIILPGAHIQSYSFVDRSIVGWDCKVGKWTRVQHNSVLGEGVVVNDGALVYDARILPHKTVAE